MDRAGRNGCTRTDAIELAAIERLNHHLSPNEVGAAWGQLQQQLRDTLPGGQLDVIFDRSLGTATIARTDDELRLAVTTGRPVVVVELGRRLHEARVQPVVATLPVYEADRSVCMWCLIE